MFDLTQWMRAYPGQVFRDFEMTVTQNGNGLFTKPMPTAERPHRTSREFLVVLERDVREALDGGDAATRNAIGQRSIDVINRVFAGGVDLGEARDPQIRIHLGSEVLDEWLRGPA